MPKLDVESLDLTDRATAVAVLMLQHAAYRVEADLIDFDGIPPLHESLEELVAAPLRWIGVRDEEGAVVGALAYTTNEKMLEIDRLVVAPDRFRNGYGSVLIDALNPQLTMTVTTGAANTPAHSFCVAHGFTRSNDEEVVPGLMITQFTREPQQ